MNRRKFLSAASAAAVAQGLPKVAAHAGLPGVLFESMEAADRVAPSQADHLNGRMLDTGKWQVYLEQPGKTPMLVESFALPETGAINLRRSAAGFDVEVSIRKTDGYWLFVASVSSKEPGRACFVSLVRHYDEDSLPVTFNGVAKESAIYRQSPHEPKDHAFGSLVMQPVPLIALKTAHALEVAICDTPAHFDNYTTQSYDLSHRRLTLSSGDNALIWHDGAFEPNHDELDRRAKGLYRIEAHYFSLDAGKEHRMEAILLRIPDGKLSSIRTWVNLATTKHWSQGSIKDLLGSTFFGTAYMNLRVNETGRSRFWVVPAIEYSNKQYSRDAFWISMVLPQQFSESCFENELSYDSDFTGAERQLFTLIWAYRNFVNGAAIDKERIEKILRIVEAHAPNAYYSGYTPTITRRGCFQGWADIVAFDSDDAISNNQGLFVTALMCTQALGIEPRVSIEQALTNYQSLFNPAINAFPISRMRNDILAVDPLMGDLLAQVYLGKALLPREHALAHYETMKSKARTEFGFKVFCAADGNYLAPDQYDSKAFKSCIEHVQNGSYQCGGSWYLYDMQMLMDAYLHGAKDAEDLMIWRTKLEFSNGGTTHEYIDTVSGQSYKPNMGWNSAVYGLWSEIVKKGKANGRFFSEIDSLRSKI